jgi:hypothetical protein
MLKRNHVELRSHDATPPMQGVADVDERKPEKLKMMVLDEGLPKKSRAPEVWLQMPNGQWVRVVVDNRLHMDQRIYRFELFDRHRQERVATFRRSTESVRGWRAGGANFRRTGW